MSITSKTLFFVLILSLIPLSANSKNDEFFNEIDRLGNIAGRENSEIIKGYAYEKGDPQKGIRADPKKALQAFYNAFLAGNPVGAYKVGFFYWELESIKEKERARILREAKVITGGITDAGYFFKKGSVMNNQMRYQEISALLAVTYGIYLFFHDESEKSIKVLTQSRRIQEKPEAQLYLAFNYLKMKNMEMADMFLSKTCNNPKAGQNIRAFCDSDKVVVSKKQ